LKKLLLILILLLSGCIIQKEIHIVIQDSRDIKVDSYIKGSDLEDLSPILEIPFP
jgi:hypothetical protein